MATSTTPPSLPQPQSYEQIQGNLLSSYASKVGISDFNVGSLVTSLFEVVALQAARSSGDVFQILKDYSITRATGDALQNLAIENGVTPVTAQPATGFVTIIDTRFTQISTQIYAGTTSPNIGTTLINISNGASFPATGSVYIGIGTPDIEGPIAYSSVVPNGNYYTMTLSAPTAKYHNINETVLLSQYGVRTIPINTLVTSPGVGSTPDIQYQTTAVATILDGETTVTNVPITAVNTGTSGNVPTNSISTFPYPPFTGASVTNPLPIASGQDTQTDDQLRTAIQLALASTGLGTATAIQNAVIGATAADQPNETIQSASVVTNPTNGSATVYIDNGVGYEATSAGVGYEHIVDSALGGEQFFQLATGGMQAPVAKAFLQSSNPAPFALYGGEGLAIVVGETTYQHVFQVTDFRSPGAATAYEIAASVNADTTLGFQATTAGGGVYSVFTAIAETEDSLQIATPTEGNGINAATVLDLQSNQVQTLRLYKNYIPLIKDGLYAEVFSQQQALWSNTITNGDTLSLSVDGTAPITYTFLNADFVATGLYSTVASSNSLESWVEVFNNKITGITASTVGTQLTISSNLGANNRANVTIVNTISNPSTLVTKAMFTASVGLSSQGRASDFTLDRNTAQFELAKPLVAEDILSAGSFQTSARIESTEITSNTITFPSNGHVWFLIDDASQIIPTGVTTGSSLTVTAVGPDLIEYTSNNATAFANVLPGDYVIVWSPQLPTTDQLEGRVYAVTNDTLQIRLTAAEYSAITPVSNVVYNSGFVVVRTPNVPQKFEIGTGTFTLDQITAALQAQTDSLTFSVLEEKYLVVVTNTLSGLGALLVVTADVPAQLMNWPVGTSSVSQTSLIALYDSQQTQADMPLFIHSTVSTDEYANPIDSYIATFDSTYNISATDPNNLIAFINPYGGIDDEQPAGENVQETSIVGSAINIAQQPDLRRLRNGIDRYYLASPLDFGYNDTLTAIIDQNPTNESFTIPFYRAAVANTATGVNANTFSAYDSASGPTTSFNTYFPNFNFANFKALLQAKKVILGQAPGAQTGILYRSASWGRTGEYINIGYVYPSSPNSAINSVVTVGSTIDIDIVLKSGASISTSIDGSTTWTVMITPNNPSVGIDQVTYSYVSGTTPGLSLSGGEYVNITNQTAFSAANKGIFRVSTVIPPSSTSFTVQRPHGVAVAEVNKATNVPTGITFYSSSATTAAAINTYVNANLSKYVTSSLVNDGGMSGSGVISLSTYENSAFTNASYFLLDGINWISSNNTATSTFNLKVPLAYPVDPYTGMMYSFNNADGNGDTVQLIPTTMEQVNQMINVLAVTGFTTYGSSTVSDRANKLELATQMLGSSGAIQLVGGSANQYVVPVLGSAARLDNTYMQISVNSIAGNAIASDQWFYLQASIAQKKTTSFGSNSDVTITPNTPIAGESTISVSDRLLTQRYFGTPRTISGLSGLTFRVENQGNLVCFSWTSSGITPTYLTFPVNFNAGGGGNLSVSLVANTEDAQYTITSGAATFSGLSIGDLVTVSGLSSGGNNGTFLVTGVSASVLEVINPNAVAEGSDTYTGSTFTATTGVMEGDSVIIGSPFNVLNQGTFRVIRVFNDSFWITNPDAVEEERVLTSSSLTFYQYDATIPGDALIISGTAFGATAAGTYPVVSITDQSDIVIRGVIPSVVSLNLSNLLSSFYILEGTPYTGYKHVYLTATQPGSMNQNYVTFDTNAQYDKINSSSGVTMTSLNKLNFNTALEIGLDSYRYATGLIGEANRIIYGDPRNPATYPGVGAAGADIFVNAPNTLRVQVSLAIRLLTGVPFVQIAATVQSTVGSLINGNPVGQSIAIGDIIAAAQAVPGVLSVAVSSPLYNVNNDLIVVQPSEKTRVIDPTTDVIVSQIGT